MIDIIKWHKDNGGFRGRLAGHALRLLGETIELCIALGATADEIRKVNIHEIDKALARNEFSRPLYRLATAGEFADVSINFEVLTHYANIHLEEARAAKFPILLHRKWEADTDGVLWQPGKRPS